MRCWRTRLKAYAKLYPATLVQEYRKALRGAYIRFHGEDARATRPGRSGARSSTAAQSRHGNPPPRAADGRLIEMNEPIELNLIRIIDGLENLADTQQSADAA